MLQIKNLVIVGGPSAAGKSTFMSRMQRGSLPSICDQLGIDSVSQPIYMEVANFLKQPSQAIDQLVLHYDFLRQSSPGSSFKHLPEIISRSDKTIAITLCVPPEILAPRISCRISDTFISFIKKPKPHTLKKLTALRKRKWFYTNPTSLHKLYKDWFACLEAHGLSDNLILDNGKLEKNTCIPYKWDEVEKMLISEEQAIL